MKVFDTVYKKEITKIFSKYIKEVKEAETQEIKSTFTTRINTLQLIKNNFNNELQYYIDNMIACKKHFNQD